MANLPEDLSLVDAIVLFNEERDNPFSLCDILGARVADMMLRQDVEGPPILRFIADTYLATDSNIVRLAIENCFVYRLGDRIFCTPERATLPKALPPVLHDILLRQMMASGI